MTEEQNLSSEHEMATMNNDAEAGTRDSNTLLHGEDDDEKCGCYRRWNMTQFVLFCVIVVVLAALLGGIFSNIDRMGGDSNSASSSSDDEDDTDYCVNGWFTPPEDYKGANTTGWDWSYDPRDLLHGPSIWDTYYPQCSCSSQQSPINIDTVYSRSNTPRRLCDSEEGLLKWTFDRNYTDAYNGTFQVLHNEHTIQMFNINKDDDGLIPIAMLDNLWQPTNSTLHSQFRLEQIHFHWGNEENGSPHTLDGKHYPLSIHFVHYSADYSSIGAAFGDALGNLRPNNKDYHVLAVVGIFFEADETNQSPIHAIDQLLQSAVLNSPNSEDEGFVEQVNITEFLPQGSGDYYYYPGSITTPSCLPVVRW
eukprot:CAMPEP_0201573522 /NCGR_PEP_ID=MMETSP0190_2-20130828/17424_1 /ASSEMBLY_ACC=CAM_ASM_000263 /TAXON_ID=37353 /ORGANISM="Rosalina sp." /LENGTH=363 /DNA_ID=CAMNT_0048000589 /DNA_START=21 /DNA_END=1109 /DNA_ORIENTATION=-